jgi:hypothetical protein
MTRTAIGTPDSQDMIDVMLYLQQIDAPEFTITGGISGTWYLLERDGEGFLIDVAPRDGGEWDLVATYYTYDGEGNQVWLIGNATTDGDGATVPMIITEGGTFGVMFMPQTVIRTDWGTLEFEFTSCYAGHVWVTPNPAMLASGRGFETFDFDIERVTPPDNCP